MKKNKSEKMDKIWACYKGDEFIVLGTIPEIAKYLDRSIENVIWMTYPSARRRSEGTAVLYEVEDGD